MIKLKIDDELELKEIEQADAQDIFNAIDNGREYLREWLPFVDFTKTVEDSADYIRSIYEAELSVREFVTTIQFNGKFAGLIGLKFTKQDKPNKKTEIGYWLAKEYQGLGIITRSARRIIKYAFDELGLNRAQIKIASANNKSIKVAERLNMKFEGTERAGELLANGFTDLRVYSILKTDDAYKLF
jgi:ribosomal-protein-serine acetyltransferase